MTEFTATNLLAESEDASSVAAMAIAVQAVLPQVLVRIGELMLAGEDEQAQTLRDHAQMLQPASELLDRLYAELDA